MTPQQRPFMAAVALIATLVLGGLLPLGLSQPARAANVPLSLYANALGWSYTQNGEKNPGPSVIVVNGDTVTITLTSDDGLQHGLFIDYDGSGLPSSGDYISQKTTSTTQFTVPADTVGQFTYADQVLPLNIGSWSTRANSAPIPVILAPGSGTSWTGGKAHDISFNLTDTEQEEMTYTLTFTYDGGSPQPIRSSSPATPNPNKVSWTPTGFSATDTVLHLEVQDSRGASGHVDSPPFEVDSTAPTIASVWPTVGAIQADRNTVVQANWSEAMNKATTGAPSAFGVRGAGGPWITGTVSWSSDAKQLTFRPSTTLSLDTVYEVHVNGSATDHSDPGNAFAAPSVSCAPSAWPSHCWTFSTGSIADTTRPSILAITADPPVQVANGFVNLTADVEDSSGISTVAAAIEGPGFNQNLTMTHASGTRWYLNRTYSAVGHYNVTVWAMDTAGNVASRAAGMDISTEGTSTLPAPASVTVDMTDGIVDVTWSAVSSPSLVGYHVYRGNAFAGPFERLTANPIPKAGPTVYRDSSAQPGHTYFYTVTSVNTTGGESSKATPFAVTIPPYTIPPLFDPVPWAVAGVTLGVILGALYGMVWRRRPA